MMNFLKRIFNTEVDVVKPEEYIQVLRSKARMHARKGSMEKKLSRSYRIQAHLLETRIDNERRQAYKERNVTKVQGFSGDAGKPIQTFEIATGKDELRVQVQSTSDMDAVSYANEMQVVKDDASGSVIAVRDE